MPLGWRTGWPMRNVKKRTITNVSTPNSLRKRKTIRAICKWWSSFVSWARNKLAHSPYTYYQIRWISHCNCPLLQSYFFHIRDGAYKKQSLFIKIVRCTTVSFWSLLALVAILFYVILPQERIGCSRAKHGIFTAYKELLQKTKTHF